MKSLIQYFTNEQRARLAGNPGANPVSTTMEPGEVITVDRQDDDVVVKKMSHGREEEPILVHARLGHPLEVLLGSLSLSTWVGIFVTTKKLRIQFPRFQLGFEELYNLEPENKYLNIFLRMIWRIRKN